MAGAVPGGAANLGVAWNAWAQGRACGSAWGHRERPAAMAGWSVAELCSAVPRAEASSGYGGAAGRDESGERRGKHPGRMVRVGTGARVPRVAQGRRRAAREGVAEEREEERRRREKRKRKKGKGEREKEIAPATASRSWCRREVTCTRNEGNKKKKTVTDAGVGTANRRERFRETRV